MKNPDLDRLISSEFDLPYAGLPSKALIIATTPRTGSNLLCSELWRRGRVGAPWEYFNRSFVVPQLSRRLGCRTRPTYIASLIKQRTGRNGVFSVKLFYEDFQFYRDDLLRYLVGAKIYYVHLVRNSLDDQVNSFIRARRTQMWASTGDQASPVNIDRSLDSPVERYHVAKGLLEQHTKWLSHFERSDVKPMTIVYERMKFPIDLERIESLLGVQQDEGAPVETPRLLKQTAGSSNVFAK
jgi:LPS sulfotransferase NodH